MKGWYIEGFLYLVAIVVLFSLAMFTIKQMDGRNDCAMAKLLNFNKEKQAIFCKQKLTKKEYKNEND